MDFVAITVTILLSFGVGAALARILLKGVFLAMQRSAATAQSSAQSNKATSRKPFAGPADDVSSSVGTAHADLLAAP